MPFPSCLYGGTSRLLSFWFSESVLSCPELGYNVFSFFIDCKLSTCYFNAFIELDCSVSMDFNVMWCGSSISLHIFPVLDHC